MYVKIMQTLNFVNTEKYQDFLRNLHSFILISQILECLLLEINTLLDCITFAGIHGL